jgi:hypothetical protein
LIRLALRDLELRVIRGQFLQRFKIKPAIVRPDGRIDWRSTGRGGGRRRETRHELEVLFRDDLVTFGISDAVHAANRS